MRGSNVILLVVLAGGLGGCAWLNQRWPWRRPEVPVTPPKEQLPVEPAPARAPASRPAGQAGGDREAPRSVRPVRQSPAAPAPSPAASGPAAPAGRSVVVAAPGLLINDRFITIEQILRAVAERLSSIPAGLSEAEFRRRAAEIIRREIRHQVFEGMVLPEAERRLTDPQKQFIDREMADRLRDMIAQFGGSRRRLEDYYLRRGTTLGKVMKLERDSLAVQVYLQSKFAPAISVNRRMLLRYYRRHKASKYTLARKVQMQIIAAPFKAFASTPAPSGAALAAARAEARKQIDKARRMLAAGEDFAEVAAKVSKGPFARKGGAWPAMARGSFRETKVEAAAFALKEGQVSDVIETDSGFFIVKAARVYPGKVISFEDAQEQIERILMDRQLGKLRAEYFDRLLARATITSSRQLVQLGTDRAVERYWRK